MNYWLLKTEPDDYSFDDLKQAGMDIWDGVRNRQAQKNIRSMKPGDQAFIYHTGDEKAIVGVGEISSAPFTDPADEQFHTVNVRAVHPLLRPVTLKEVKEAPQFEQWALVRQPRLSVMPVPAEHWRQIIEMSES